MEEKLWVDNFNELLDTKKIDKFLPIEGYTKNEKINSIVRLSFYISIILSFLLMNFNYLSIFVMVLLVTYLVNLNNIKDDNKTKNKDKETFINREKK